VRIAVFGDIHEHWGPIDCAQIDAGGYDLALFVGDLGDRLHRRTLDTARRLAPLRTPALLLPGNHDATSPIGGLAEAIGRGLRRPGAVRRHLRRRAALVEALGPVAVAGYSAHPFPAHDLTVIAARPHAMDGLRVTFADLLGIDTMDDSAARLRSLVDATEGPLLFLAHNGPRGLGTDAEAPFALRRGGRDIGDPDLADAVAWARHRGRAVVAVVAGHLHHRGHDRRWNVEQDGVRYVNAARVPRVWDDGHGRVRHHVALEVANGRAEATAVLLPG
jgi:uncharacterized protein (TIGR04168 family)